MAPTIDPAAGLCAQCVHVKALASSRGSVFYRCQLADSNIAFARYPRLPVLTCRGYQAVAPDDQNKGRPA